MKLSADQQKRIAELFKAGYTIKEISAKMDLKYEKVAREITKMRKNGIEVKRWWK